MGAMHADRGQLPQSYGAKLETLTLYNEERESFLSRIVIGDETWLHYWTQEYKSISTA